VNGFLRFCAVVGIGIVSVMAVLIILGAIVLIVPAIINHA
jgi:hypothetical protein